METVNTRSCGECTACCDGYLAGNAYGNFFGKLKPCVFVCKTKGCNIYENRPDFCKKFQCGWYQGMLDEDLRPDKSNILVTTEIDAEGKKFALLVECKEDIDQTTKERIITWMNQNKVPIKVLPFQQLS